MKGLTFEFTGLARFIAQIRCNEGLSSLFLTQMFQMFMHCVELASQGVEHRFDGIPMNFIQKGLKVNAFLNRVRNESASDSAPILYLKERAKGLTRPFQNYFDISHIHLIQRPPY